MKSFLRNLLRCVITLLPLLYIACSSPTNPSVPIRILEQLLDVHTFSLPPETEANKINEGYLLTAENLSEVLSERHGSYQSWIEPFYNESIAAEKHEDYYRWRRPLDNPNDRVVILTVTPGDTLAFQIEFEGSGWGPPGTYWFKGWVIPEIKKAYMWGGNGIELSWINLQLGHRLFVSRSGSFGEGPKAVAFDSTNGGGYLEMKMGLSLQFEAHWDNYGHGTWWSATQGSGEW